MRKKEENVGFCSDGTPRFTKKNLYSFAVGTIGLDMACAGLFQGQLLNFIYMTKVFNDPKQLVDNALKLCNIEYLRNAKTTALSGGEKQLVAIAAVLTMQPKILIADEITSNIDMERKETVRGILTDYAKNGGSVIMVSHIEKDMAIANRIITMERGKDYAD